MTTYQRVLFGSAGDTIKTENKVLILASFTALLRLRYSGVKKLQNKNGSYVALVG